MTVPKNKVGYEKGKKKKSQKKTSYQNPNLKHTERETERLWVKVEKRQYQEQKTPNNPPAKQKNIKKEEAILTVSNFSGICSWMKVLYVA